MNIYTHYKSGILLLLASLLLVPAATAQSVSLGADVVSRYVWRGFDFGESVSVQPALTFGSGGLEVGAWASYAFSGDGGANNEVDLWASYGFETATAGSFSIGITDYYFPSPGTEFFNFDDGEGAHTLEPFLSYSGPESFPISLLGAMNVYNDPDNSVYLEASYPFSIDGVELGLTAGLTPSAGVYADDFAFVNLGLSAAKEIAITEQFSLPVFVSYIVNPDQERSFLVFGLSF